MPPKNKKQLNLIIALGSGSNKGIGGPDKDAIGKFLKKDPKNKGLFSKGKD